MFSSSANIIYVLKEPSISAQARTAAIRAIKILYTDCFEKRARPVLSHLDEPGASSINSICYMSRDVTPINTWGNKGDCEYFELSLEVLEFALHLKNPACKESALHGLGHMAVLEPTTEFTESLVTGLGKRKQAVPSCYNTLR